MNKVCQDDIAPATSPSRQLQDEEEAAATAPRKLPTTRKTSESSEKQHLLNLKLEQKPPRSSLPEQSTQSPYQSQAQGAIPRTPLRPPAGRTKEQEPEQRLYLSPSELPKAKLDEMNRLLAEQDVKVRLFPNQIPSDEDIFRDITFFWKSHKLRDIVRTRKTSKSNVC
jgi:hypothetical protein